METVTSVDLRVKCEVNELSVPESANVSIECFTNKPVHECVWVKVRSKPFKKYFINFHGHFKVEFETGLPNQRSTPNKISDKGGLRLVHQRQRLQTCFEECITCVAWELEYHGHSVNPNCLIIFNL